ncbi:MAG TPA: site-specific integrase [Pyrinomonadaceae bacterium]|nr:site-specific integrase [Pyrinomonadaceae bacterium]
MRQELSLYGEESFKANKIEFDQLLAIYEKGELTEATFQSGIKVKGRRSIPAVLSAIKPLREYFGKRRIRSIKANDIKNYKDHRLNTPVEVEVNEKGTVFDKRTGQEKTEVKKVIRSHQRKIASVNRELELLRAILNYAVQNEWLIKNPFALTKGIISKAAEVQRDRVLSNDEEQRLLDVCVDRKSHLRPLLICALDTAMRRGEIFKMVWKDVDLLRNEIYIPQTNTKTEVARTVGVTKRLREEFGTLWEASSKNLSKTVFGITNTIKTSFKSACDEAEIRDFRFHDCRHTATTRMIASGSPHTEVMKITGHSQLKTFLRYLNITPETTNRVASNLDNYLTDNQFSADDISETVN